MSAAKKKAEIPKLFAFRSASPFAERLIGYADEARLKPNQLVRIAAMFFVNSGVLGLRDSVERIESRLSQAADELSQMRDDLVRLRKDIANAASSEPGGDLR